MSYLVKFVSWAPINTAQKKTNRGLTMLLAQLRARNNSNSLKN